jgi:hypothetical protein
MECACCGRPIEQRYAWKGSAEHFYCSGFCADSEDENAISVPQLSHLSTAGRRAPKRQHV